MLRVSLICLAVLALWPAAASAHWRVDDYFQSQTSNTFCWMSRNTETNENRVRCAARSTRPGRCTTGYVLRRLGEARRTRVCDRPPADAPRVSYGQWLYMFGGTPKIYGDRTLLRCIFRHDGLTCRNRDQHGFFVRVGHGRTF